MPVHPYSARNAANRTKSKAQPSRKELSFRGGPALSVLSPRQNHCTDADCGGTIAANRLFEGGVDGGQQALGRHGQPLRAVREQIAQLQLAEPGQRQVEAAELQFAELEAEEFAIPSRV
jgi:hypothetical protein